MALTEKLFHSSGVTRCDHRAVRARKDEMFERKPLIADVVGSSPPVAASNQGESFAVQRNHAVFADSPLPTRTLITAARRSARKVSGRRCN